jgi:hypothetical protein
VAEESGGAHFGFGGAMLLDLPGPALRLLTDVADLHFSDIAVRGDDGARAIGANDDAAAVELRGLCFGPRTEVAGLLARIPALYAAKPSTDVGAPRSLL